MDEDGSGYLDTYEFSKALKDYRINLTNQEQQQLFATFDENGDGNISYEEFLKLLVGEMNAQRKNIVKKAF